MHNRVAYLSGRLRHDRYLLWVCLCRSRATFTVDALHILPAHTGRTARCLLSHSWFQNSDKVLSTWLRGVSWSLTCSAPCIVHNTGTRHRSAYVYKLGSPMASYSIVPPTLALQPDLLPQRPKIQLSEIKDLFISVLNDADSRPPHTTLRRAC
jgi:hypothetical protein